MRTGPAPETADFCRFASARGLARLRGRPPAADGFVQTDYVSKRIFGLSQENGALKTFHQLARIPQGLVSFTMDEPGNIYAVGFEGRIYRLDFTESNFGETKPE